MPARKYAEEFIGTMLQPPLLHGDEKHKEWLTQELQKYIEPLEHLLEKTELEAEQASRQFHLIIKRADKVVHERFMHFYSYLLTPEELGGAIEQGILQALDRKQRNFTEAG